MGEEGSEEEENEGETNSEEEEKEEEQKEEEKFEYLKGRYKEYHSWKEKKTYFDEENAVAEVTEENEDYVNTKENTFVYKGIG
jgi:hypothetical protein